MTVPAPRSEQVPDNVIVGWLQRIEETTATGFRDLHASIDKLRDETVHRREFDRYRDERAIAEAERQRSQDRALADLREAHEKERATREERERAEEQRREAREDQERRDRRVDWRWRWGLAAGAATAFGAAVVSHTTWHF